MSKHVVFISLPMSGIPDDMVKENIEKAKIAYSFLSGRSINDVSFIATMDNPDPPDYIKNDQIGVWYLGHSLTKLAKCDECFFYTGWKNARGCLIEWQVCKQYGIDILES